MGTSECEVSHSYLLTAFVYLNLTAQVRGREARVRRALVKTILSFQECPGCRQAGRHGPMRDFENGEPSASFSESE